MTSRPLATLLLTSTAGTLALLAGLGLARDAGEAARVAAVTRPTTDFSEPEPYERHPAGAATSFKPLNSNAFSHPSANMSFERELDFRVGDGIFRKLWVSSPSSTRSSDGIGPIYNARSCQACHIKDGRGRPPAPGEVAVSMFLRLSVPPQTQEQRQARAANRIATVPEPVYGRQLQNFSVQGVLAEGRMTLEYEEFPVILSDGQVVHLRRPTYGVTGLNHGPLHPDTMLSPRVAPPMIGMGLIEAIPETDILALTDPDDSDGDGVSGRPNRVWSKEHGRVMPGRFGWKAGEPTVAQQAAHAFAGDMGLSSHLAPDPWGDCTAAQVGCRDAPDGRDADEGVEVTRQMLDLVTFYARNLAVPARRDLDDPQVLRGKRLFYESRCIACHRPKFVTRRDSIGESQSFQLIWPYSDFLLHDMGPGLADGRPEGEASGREWRTAPLWGIGLTEMVSGHTFFLHDGRARNLLEAILWHGGEAEAAKQRVVAMTKAEREALIAFLRSL